MTLPAVTVSKNTFTTGQASPASTGVLALLCASSTGTVNTPGGYSRTDGLITDFGYGPLADFAAYDINVANKPVLAVKGNATYPGAYGTISSSLGTGTTAVTAGGTAPFDDYNVELTITNSGTVGVDGIKYTYSLDGGVNVSGVQSLGTANSIAIPNSGVSFALAAGTLIAGETFQVYTTRPLLADADVTAGLTALGTTRLPFEGVLIDCSAGSSTIGLVDTILSGWEQRGVFKFALLNTRYKTNPEPTAETETAYATALSAQFGTSTSIRSCLGADGAHVSSPITGYSLKRPTALFVAARAMAIPIGEDPAYIGRGALVGAQIADTKGNPLDHDEDLYPNLDNLRLMSLRSFAPGGPQGVYICNANTMQPSGGSFPYLQHIRIMNRAAEIAWSTLTQQLSLGVRKNTKKDPVTGAVTIFEPDAALIDSLVNDALLPALAGQVSAAKFTLSRTDDLNAIPVIVTGLLEIVAKAYIKGILVQAQFSKVLSTSV